MAQIRKWLMPVLITIACAYFALVSSIQKNVLVDGTSHSASAPKQVPVSAQNHQQMDGADDVPAYAIPVSLQQLPTQGQQTYRLILQGGPFPYEKDGSVFGNRERLLPSQKRGYYREYTVRTPKVRHRGARRIVCGGWVAHKPKACYYTADHYDSFQRIDAAAVGSVSILN